MVSETLALPSALREEIVAHARAGAPDEVCGLVVGRAGQASRVIRCRNAHETPRDRYRVDAREQLAAFRDMEERGEELVAIYHSHPAGPSEPSAVDRAEAQYPEAAYLIVSLRSGAPELAAYRIRAAGATPIDLA